MATGRLKKFKKATRYVHKRSEGLTHRKNKGSRLQGRVPVTYWAWEDGKERTDG
jgi:hypothetical protein